jgi:glycoprotein endo-alpha-1,2-mannosidase
VVSPPSRDRQRRRAAKGLAAASAVVLLGALAHTAAVAGGKMTPEPSVAIFYYPWWSTPQEDGHWSHWNQRGSKPPATVAANFYPARGVYSSSDGAVVRAQMREIASLGIDTVITSWWGTGSPEDKRLGLVTREARRVGLAVAIHVEPWGGRTPSSTAHAIAGLAARGYRDFYVYNSTTDADDDWSSALADHGAARVFANTALVGKAQAGGFDGFYTYDVYVYSGTAFRRTCRSAHVRGLLCSPSVGPGYDARRATGDTRTQSRKAGGRYDSMWRQIIRAEPDIVTITSYNEWHEGTQIEPARASAGYESYEGAYGATGAAAEGAYLERTGYWIGRMRTGG